MNKAIRKNEGKVRLDLVPPSIVTAIGEVLTAGLNKYPDRNWEKGFPLSTPYASLMRHLLSFWNGETNDPETGLSHLKHAAANLAMMIEFMEKKPHLDDRPNLSNEPNKSLTTQTEYPDNVDADMLSPPVLTDSDLEEMSKDYSLFYNHSI